MSRHRYIRRVSLGDDDYDDSEGQSFDEKNFAVSPGTMDTYLYKRMEQHSMSDFIQSEIPEENDQNEDDGEDTATAASAAVAATENSIKKKPSEEENMFQMDSQSEQKKNKISGLDREPPTKPITPSSKASVRQPSRPLDIEAKAERTPKKQVESESVAYKPAVLETKRKDTPVKQKPSEPISSKPTINMVVVGHVDAGKSTLMGHLLYQIGQVNDKVMHRNKQESQKAGKGSFCFAWVLDETEEERSRGVTIDVAQTKFETEKKIVNLLDAPGHKDFIPNMITGAAIADCAILVINSTKGEFETGFEAGGQTREHSLLLRSLGIAQLAVAVNKMDTCDWCKERFDEICKKLGAFLKQVGFKESELVFIPCSGLIGENLTKKPENCPLNDWYKGGTILDCINNFLSPERRIDKPLRVSVTDIFKASQSSLVSLAGKVETGYVNSGDKVIIMPSGQTGVIKSITSEEDTVKCAYAGDSVIINIPNVEISTIAVGDIICDCVNEPVKFTNLIKGRVILFNVDIPVTKGSSVVFHYKSANNAATIKRLVSQLNKSTGEVVKERPRLLTGGMSAVVEIQTQKPFCAELFQDFKELGRFMLRTGNATIAAGQIIEISPFNQT